MTLIHRLVLTLGMVLLAECPVYAQEDGFPYRDPYVATITGSSLNADGLTAGIRRQVIHVTVLPGRDRLPSLQGRGALSIALYRQKQPAPLMIILPGTGSSPYFGLPTYIAKLFYEQGSHVIILPSLLHWNFALAASRSGAPGYTPADARDLYDALQRVLVVLQDHHGIKITRIDFLGLSLGALEGAYLSAIDADEGRLGIDRYLLLNPPFDVPSVMRKLDEWDALQEKLGPRRAREVTGKALGMVEAFAKQGRDDPKAIDGLARGFALFTRDELQFLIAAYLQTALPELATVTQAIHDQGVFSAPDGQVRKRLQEAKRMTFTEYSEKIAGPIWRAQAGEPDTSVDAFVARGSLATILDRLKENPRVFVMHSADDFFADGPSMEELKMTLGERITIYPYGGHVGNLWFPPTRTHVLAVFRD